MSSIKLSIFRISNENMVFRKSNIHFLLFASNCLLDHTVISEDTMCSSTVDSNKWYLNEHYWLLIYVSFIHNSVGSPLTVCALIIRKNSLTFAWLTQFAYHRFENILRQLSHQIEASIPKSRTGEFSLIVDSYSIAGWEQIQIKFDEIAEKRNAYMYKQIICNSC